MVSRLDTITRRMSVLMLKRWSMLAEVCPAAGCNSPLMRSPESGKDKCVWHDANELFPEEVASDEPDCMEGTPEVSPTLAEREDEKLDVPAKNSSVRDAEVRSEPAARPEDDGGDASRLRLRKREQSDLASERIAKRLLQGWAMIDRSCPAESCYSVPLVQGRDKIQECVICSQRYMDEDAYIAKYGSLENIPGPACETAPKEAQVAAPRATQMTAPMATQATRLEQIPVLEPARALGVAVSERRRSEPRWSEGQQSGAAAVVAAVYVLNEKVAALSAQIAAATDPSDIEQLARAIAACAKAVRHCSRAR